MQYVSKLLEQMFRNDDRRQGKQFLYKKQGNNPVIQSKILAFLFQAKPRFLFVTLTLRRNFI